MRRFESSVSTAGAEFLTRGYVMLTSFFFSSRRRHTRCSRDWSSDVCSSDLALGGKSRCVLIRADMDALPVEEANDVPYRSQHEGKMHACGHDGHVAIGLEVARSEEHTSELQSRLHLVCRLLLEKKTHTTQCR